ncbi:hypothetical protein, partial [Bifidobacterium aquikefiri]|uniref:hypothetical protein n=1 Tax=Bifidobacterium aquikefiri TaxID=1653207 RepID=UPI0039ED48C5
ELRNKVLEIQAKGNYSFSVFNNTVTPMFALRCRVPCKLWQLYGHALNAGFPNTYYVVGISRKSFSAINTHLTAKERYDE